MTDQHEFSLEHSGPYVRVVCDDCPWTSDHWRYAPGINVQKLLRSDETAHRNDLTRAAE